MAAEPVVSVVICTHNRPDMLAQAVQSCLTHATRTNLPFEVVVADNSADEYAAGVLAGFRTDRTLRPVKASPQNISVARNAGIRASRGSWVAFLDDDQVVEPGWLDSLVATARRTEADVVLGAVVARYEEGRTPERDWGLFSRELDWPSGSIVALSGPARPPRFSFGTGNSLWDRARCFGEQAPFDEAFGACGGEDFELYLRLERRGRRFAWCPEAVVSEVVPHARTSLRHHLKRAFSGAQVYVAATVKNSDRPRTTTAGLMGRGLLQAGLWGVAAPALLPASRLMRLWRGRFRKREGVGRGVSLGEGRFGDAVLSGLAFGLGKLLWWRRLALYQREAASRAGPARPRSAVAPARNAAGSPVA